nr:immunoglobulin heavy chain junction region [Mus musculus]MBK4196506.1 immunoglobulin heavy chain junction region [Mus musculus]MBK4196507.1 immunoglobulin heavy chain junction region [Mus musculus]MBK4196508.1 immunoglobulin heavy chain junction region [Mus musculus]MBK4196509.1 immunoglobulin heavy chain junction region [Mus musculus]
CARSLVAEYYYAMDYW